MKSYEELLSDIEEDMELMGSSHIVYHGEEDGIITDYDYLPSDSCTISIPLKELQEKIQLQMLYDKASSHTAEADNNAPKLAVVFPGIGYGPDKPLLYYAARLARNQGYQILNVSYGSLPENVKGDRAKMEQAFELALKHTEQFLQNVDWHSYGSILFISKSLGTIISSAYASRHWRIPFLSHWPEASPSTAPQIPGPKPKLSRSWHSKKRYLFFLQKTPTIHWKPAMC